MPENRKRVVYLDPSRTDYVIPANALKSSTMSAYQIAENIVDCYKRVYPETLSEAPRFAQIMRNTIVVLVGRGLTLLELEPFLTNARYRYSLLADFPDEQVTRFFSDQYDRWGRDQATFSASSLNKVTAYLFQPSVRASLTATENVLDFRTIIDEGKILICDLGGLTGETQELYGSMLVANWEQASMSRRELREHERKPYLLMIDEFPSFVSRDTKTLARILSEIRKYKCYAALCHQTISQTDSRMQGAIENCDCQMAMKTGRATAYAMAQQLFLPNPDLVKHEVTDEEAKERSHPVFEQLQTQVEMAVQKLMRLQKRHMMVKLAGDDTLYHVKTPTVPPARITHKELAWYIKELLKQIGKPIEEIERERDSRQPQQATLTRTHKPKPVQSSEGWEDKFYEKS